jgi:DNA-binding LytR/AlgR family response regulator
MIHVAIVDDEEEQLEATKALLLRYEKEHDTALRITTFSDAVSFLDPYKGDYDIVILDVKMPYLNGIDAARKLREMDEGVILFFLTTMEQYAIRGYEVAAMDYLIKPINYFDFALRFARAVKKIDKAEEKSLILKTEAGIVKVFPNQIYYVEVSGHYCLYHTATGNYRQYYSIRKLEQELREENFALCNSFLLVNLSRVERIDGMSVFVHGDELQISHPKKKAFLERFAAYTEGRRKG